MDHMISLAFAVQKNRGVYALLLGSGVSRAARVPTGWEVVEDLVRQVARVQGADPEPDPAAWFRDAFGREPGYSELLEEIARSPAEPTPARLLRADRGGEDRADQDADPCPPGDRRARGGRLRPGDRDDQLRPPD